MKCMLGMYEVCVDRELQTWNMIQIKSIFIFIPFMGTIECHFVVKIFFFFNFLFLSWKTIRKLNGMKIHYVWLVQNCILPYFLDVKYSRELTLGSEESYLQVTSWMTLMIVYFFKQYFNCRVIFQPNNITDYLDITLCLVLP